MSGEQTTFLAGAAEAAATTTTTAAAPAGQSTAEAVVPPPPQAAAGQTAATPGATAPAETSTSTSGQAEATNPAPVEVKVPAGVEMDGGLLEAIKSKDPQKVVDAYAAMEEQQRAAWDAQGRKWVTEIETDKEFGGANLDQTKVHVAKALTKYGSPDLIKQIDEFGLGNHPSLIRFVARVGKAMSEDTVAGTTAATNGSGSPDYRGWFPGQNLNP